jgi:hypothetical protein
MVISILFVLASFFAKAESEDQCTDRCYEELGECEYVCQEKIGCQTKCATSKLKCEKDCSKKSTARDFTVGYVSHKTASAYSYALGLRMAASDANTSGVPGFSMKVSAKIRESRSEVLSALRAFCVDPGVSVVVGGDALPEDSPIDNCNKPYVQIGDSSAFSRAQSGLRLTFGADIRRQVLVAAESLNLSSSSAKVAILLPPRFDNQKFLDEFSSVVARKGGSVHALSVSSNGSVNSRRLTTAPGEIRAIVHMARPDATSTFVLPQGTSVSGGAVHFIPDERCKLASSNPPPVCIRPGADLSSKEGRAFQTRMNQGVQASTSSIDASVEYAAIGFDLGKVLSKARERAGRDSPDRLANAIRDYSGTGLSGPIAFDSSGVRKTAPVVLLEIRRQGARRIN